jgi:hypothetical protein
MWTKRSHLATAGLIFQFQVNVNVLTVLGLYRIYSSKFDRFSPCSNLKPDFWSGSGSGFQEEFGFELRFRTDGRYRRNDSAAAKVRSEEQSKPSGPS